jgi:hypothetical protein
MLNVKARLDGKKESDGIEDGDDNEDDDEDDDEDEDEDEDDSESEGDMTVGPDGEKLDALRKSLVTAENFRLHVSGHPDRLNSAAVAFVRNLFVTCFGAQTLTPYLAQPITRTHALRAVLNRKNFTTQKPLFFLLWSAAGD